MSWAKFYVRFVVIKKADIYWLLHSFRYLFSCPLYLHWASSEYLFLLISGLSKRGKVYFLQYRNLANVFLKASQSLILWRYPHFLDCWDYFHENMRDFASIVYLHFHIQYFFLDVVIVLRLLPQFIDVESLGFIFGVFVQGFFETEFKLVRACVSY